LEQAPPAASPSGESQQVAAWAVDELISLREENKRLREELEHSQKDSLP
jgi:hypothetical protein